MEAGSAELWNIYDKTLLEKVAHDEGISMDLLKKMGDLTRRLEALGLHPSTHVNQDAAFEKVANCLPPDRQGGYAIIVGRGGAILCHDLNNCFHFRLEASFEWRVHSLMKRLALHERKWKRP